MIFKSLIIQLESIVAVNKPSQGKAEITDKAWIQVAPPGVESTGFPPYINWMAQQRIRGVYLA